MRFFRESIIRASPERVFSFHEQPEALTLLLPPWERARVIKPAKISQPGSQAIVELRLLGLVRARWVAEHTAYDPPYSFEDLQAEGPFRSWRHRHIIQTHPQGAILQDEIHYEPPLGYLGRCFARVVIDRRLKRLFAYRHEVTRRWCEATRNEGRDG